MAEEVFAFPASFAQQRLWFLDQLEPGSILYNIPINVRFQGPLDLAALEQAFNELTRRYEILRTTFSMIEQEPVQVVSPPANARLPLIDVSHLSASEQQTKVLQFANEEALQPFDLAEGPLMRVKLLKLGPDDHVLSVTMHHIISDGWSKAIFIREIKTLYEAYSKGLDSPLPELPIQYADFAIWQREWLQGEVIESMLAYWKPQLEGLGALDLPSDRPRPPVQTSNGATYSFVLPESLCASLNSLSRSQGVTLFMTLLAALQVLLSRYTGADDIAIGTMVAGRNRAETEHMIGLFTNTLVMRTDLSGEPSFTKALERVRKVCLDAYAHQDIPFEKLIMELQPARDLSRSPLFQVMLILQNVPQEQAAPQWSELSLSAVETTGVVSRFDLSLSVTEGGGRLNGLVEYNTDLFDERTVARMMDHYQIVLEEMVRNPEQNINEISLLSDADRQLILLDWNDTARDYPRDKCIHELFEAQVELAPESIALVFEGQQLTYSELNRRANQLAHHLRGLGAGPDVPVGVCLERSLDTMVALLGVLKAGAAYVPLDPTYPADRLSLMVQDAGIELLLTQDKLKNLLVDAKTKIVSLRNDRDSIARNSDQNPVHQTTADNLAYVIYTSGSTGRPKGVMVAHRNVLNFFAAMDDCLSPQGVWLALTSISFDISVLELFWTLTNGYKVVIQAEQREIVSKQTERRASDKGMQFSLFYFASDGNTADKEDKYRLLIEGAKFADQNDFVAVWTPERHFHAFGDLYPNPAVTGAAIATITEHIQIRAGSVVLPLHHPIRVAEEWAMIDNLSHGRVGISFASGWHAADFVFAPENYAQRRRIMAEHIDVVRKLWRGEKLPFPGGSGQDVEIGILPRPLQAELPVWLTSGGTPDTFRLAGEKGMNLLTHLLGQSVEELAEKIAIYRNAWREAGYEGAGHVSLMLHTFVGPDIDEVREKVRQPFTNYLASSLDLMKNLAKTLGVTIGASDFTDDDMQVLLAHAFERYFGNSGLMGTPEMCLDMIERLKEIGVDEVACLIDFGVEREAVLESLHDLNEIRKRSNQIVSEDPSEPAKYSFAMQVESHNVTHVQCTPSMASMLTMDEESARAMTQIQTLLLGGEALPPSLVEELRKEFSGEIHNMYGPTETTIWSATHQVKEASHTIPLGKPLANTQIYILDKLLKPQPVGLLGEIYIGGEGVVRGYLTRPELTADRFLPDPYSGQAGTRMYRTGDVGRFLSDGTIEFAGRIDQQVKVRGHRIELGEIEAVLSEHPDVRESAVVARESGFDDKRLSAYLVVDKEPAPNAGELRSYLRKKLPEYMIPSSFVVLDALPLTPNGKLDRRALPVVDQIQDKAEDKFVAPRTPAEERLSEIWAQVLGVSRIGVLDNFFDLGGHSLLATRLVHEIRRAFAINLPLRSLFDEPTIAGLALRIEEILLAEIEQLGSETSQQTA